jgi:hypothetical protein
LRSNSGPEFCKYIEIYDFYIDPRNFYEALAVNSWPGRVCQDQALLNQQGLNLTINRAGCALVARHVE